MLFYGSSYLASENLQFTQAFKTYVKKVNTKVTYQGG